MKYLVYLIAALATVHRCLAQTTPETHEWAAALKIVDENNQPVDNAAVSIFYNVPPESNDPGKITGVTDSNGAFSASHSDHTYGLRFVIEKAGYYTTDLRRDFGGIFTPEKLKSDLTLILKKVGIAIPMYARQAQIEIPATDKPKGFDFAESDWVAPDGKGKHSDVIFTASRRWVSRRDFDVTAKMSFPNSGDGLASSTTPLAPGSSGPEIPVIAPAKDYVSEHEVRLSHTPAGGWSDDSPKQNYYLRVRTVMNSDGTVKSALYGKIYGGFGLDPINSKTTFILFTYYLNPTSNDRNTEFDPKQNLIDGLKSFERVAAP